MSIPRPCRLARSWLTTVTGRLVSTVYMLPIEDLTNKDKRFDDLAAPGGKVDHVDVYFNAGHPGVEKPHAHVVLWHVPKADETRVAGK